MADNIQGPYQFQRRYSKINGAWEDINFARAHQALRACFDDPLGAMVDAIADGKIVETPDAEYRAVRHTRG